MNKIVIVFLFLCFTTVKAQNLFFGINTAYNYTQLRNRDDIKYNDYQKMLKNFEPSYGLVLGYNSNKISIILYPKNTSISQSYYVHLDTNSSKAKLNIRTSLQQIQIPLVCRYVFKNKSLLQPFIEVGAYYAMTKKFEESKQGTIYDTTAYKLDIVNNIGNALQINNTYLEYTFSNIPFKKSNVGMSLGFGVNYKLQKNIFLNASTLLQYSIGNIENRDSASYSFNINGTKYTYPSTPWIGRPRFNVPPAIGSSNRPSTHILQLGLSISLLYSFNINKKNNE